MEVLTNGVGTKEWEEISKDWYIYAYVPGSPIGDVTEGLSSEEQDSVFTKQDSEKVLKEVSRKIKK